MKAIKKKHPHRKVRSKWIRRTGVRLSVYQNAEGGLNCFAGDDGSPRVMADGAILDLFVWLGRYLAEKRKLPRHLTLDMIAIGANRTSKDIRSVVAMETLDTAVGPSGLEITW